MKIDRNGWALANDEFPSSEEATSSLGGYSVPEDVRDAILLAVKDSAPLSGRIMNQLLTRE